MASAALVLQTQDSCPVGLLGDWALSRGIALDIIRVDRWLESPDPGNYDFAVALGSDAALVLGHWHLKREKDEIGGVFTLVVQRFPEGWRIIHDHTSASPPDTNPK